MVRFVPYGELAVKLPTRRLWHGPGRQRCSERCGGNGNSLQLIRVLTTKVTLSGYKASKG